MKVLIDNSVRAGAVSPQNGHTSPNGTSPSLEEAFLQTQAGRPKRDWRQFEIEFLPNIANLIKEGLIQPFTTLELAAEATENLQSASNVNGDEFANIEFGRLTPTLNRTKLGVTGDQLASRENMIAFCESFFLTSSLKRTQDLITMMRENPRFELSDFEEACLRRSNLFRAICKGISEYHYPDALHLWTAEENGVEVFLTMDAKFRNAMDRQNVHLKCKILFPSDIVDRIGRGRTA